MTRSSARSTTLGGLFVVIGFILISTGDALKGNSWQKRVDRAFLQVDGVSPQGRVRSLQRALRDPDLRKDVTKAIDVVRKKGFGKGHPEFIELLWPEGTQARKDLEAINALTKQLPERTSQLQKKSSSAQTVIDIIQSTQKSLRFGEDGSRVVVSSLFEKVQSDPNRMQRLSGNFLRNEPTEVESPSFKLLGKYTKSEATTTNETKSFLTVPPLELRKYDAFRSLSVQLQASDSFSNSDETYTLNNMGPALTEIFSYLELGYNLESTLMQMTTPFFISDVTGDSRAKMFVKLPSNKEANPPDPNDSSAVEFDNFPETVMATLAFPGICTDEEIKRQKDKLIKRIEEAGDIEYTVKNDDDQDEENKPEFYVLQYNAPGTLPWRRVNEIAVVMEASVSADTTVADADTTVTDTDTTAADADTTVADTEIEEENESKTEADDE